jgi:uncharacterized surface protein with fasciclin (FAS1) repeats
MRFTTILLFAGVAGATLSACDRQAAGTNEATTEAAREAAGDETLAEGLGQDTDSRFLGAVKSVGLDRTLAGPGPYTVLVPANAAFDKLGPESTANLLKPESRASTTELLTFHILPGTILSADIAKAIDNGGGKTSLMTMQGGTITAAKEGDSIVLTDSSGGKAIVGAVDDKRSNGVIHRIDTVLMPAKSG